MPMWATTDGQHISSFSSAVLLIFVSTNGHKVNWSCFSGKYTTAYAIREPPTYRYLLNLCYRSFYAAYDVVMPVTVTVTYWLLCSLSTHVPNLLPVPLHTHCILWLLRFWLPCHEYAYVGVKTCVSIGASSLCRYSMSVGVWKCVRLRHCHRLRSSHSGTRSGLLEVLI